MGFEVFSPEAWEYRKAQKEYEEYMNEMYEKSLVVEAQFDDVMTYCKEHEGDFMKMSKMFLEEFDADVTPEEIIEIVQNNTSSEWVNLSKLFTLDYFGENISVDKGIYYHYTGGGGSSLGVLYIDADHMDADEIDYHTNPSRDEFLSKICKVNDYLYVCIYRDPMVGI